MSVHRMEYFDPESNIIVREMRFELAGEVVPGHEHDFPHSTYVAKGAATIRIGEFRRTLRAADGLCWMLVRAGELHEITAEEDGTIVHCIFAHRTPQGEVSMFFTGRGAG